MLKLVKYEWRKQRTTRLIILGLLAAGLIIFWGSVLLEKDNVTMMSLAFLYTFAVIVLFYTGVESIFIFNRDLRTKQSYMLFMVPKSIWQILGAKFISAILQMLFVFVLFLAAGCLSLVAAIWRSGKIEAIVRAADDLVQALTHSQLAWGILIEGAFILFLAWALVIMIGFVAVVLARTVLVKSKFSGLFAFILFFVINVALEWGYRLSDLLPRVGEMGYFNMDVWNILYYIAACGGLFLAAGWLADRKLSV